MRLIMPNSRKSKKVVVYENLKKRIINNSLKSGESLSESVLAKELKISKTPIREAFQQLEKEGFIENIPGKGSFVSRISVQDIREIFEIREILECEVIRRIVQKGDLSKIEVVRKKFESSEGDGNGDAKSYFKAGDQIHSLIFETFGNSRLIETYKRLQEHIARMRFHFFNEPRQDRTGQSFKEHLEVLDALVAQDPLRAEKAMRTHLQNSVEYLKKII
jgi:GntR family transcriptional regulator, rspAB operon transcriptional repressor